MKFCNCRNKIEQDIIIIICTFNENVIEKISAHIGPMLLHCISVAQIVWKV